MSSSKSTIAAEKSPVPSAAAARLRLAGVDHTARPTWKLQETVEFYRDILGLPLVHAISARGWGPATHPDFLHIFFDSGCGSAIAFFYYLAQPEPAEASRPPYRPWPEDHLFDATHTAWLVERDSDLRLWKSHLEEKGVEVSVETAHEVIESIYFRDPNGYFLEITRKLRPLGAVDAADARATVEAAIELEREAAAERRRIASIDAVWRRKADRFPFATPPDTQAPIVVLVPDVSEFEPIVRAARQDVTCHVSEARAGYRIISAHEPIVFHRRKLGLKPAVWYGLLTGGIRGTIEQFDREVLRIGPAKDQ